MCAWLPSDISSIVSKDWPPYLLSNGKAKVNRVLSEKLGAFLKNYDKRQMYDERGSDNDSE